MEEEQKVPEQPEQPEQVQEEEKKKKKMPLWLKRVIITVSAILMALLLLGGAALWVLYHYAGRLGDYDKENDKPISLEQADKLDKDDALPMDPDDENNPDLPSVDDIDPTPVDPPVVNKDKDVVNILIVGQDSKNSNVRTRSDTMILITIHTKAKQVTLTSFLRDAYVTIPGYADNKLNSAYEKGGLKLLNETLKVNFGVEVDGNVIIDFSSFQKIIDMLDGVDIQLTEREAEYLVNGGKHEDIRPGWNRLNGQQALEYARLREIDNDYKRANRQRTVILSLIERYKTLSLTEMLAMLDQILPLIVTDMDENTIVELVLKCGPLAAAASYGTQQIPADGTFKQGFVKVREGLKNWFQYNINFDENRRIIQEIMNGNR